MPPRKMAQVAKPAGDTAKQPMSRMGSSRARIKVAPNPREPAGAASACPEGEPEINVHAAIQDMITECTSRLAEALQARNDQLVERLATMDSPVATNVKKK
jgi:hypothetical protein